MKEQCGTWTHDVRMCGRFMCDGIAVESDGEGRKYYDVLFIPVL